MGIQKIIEYNVGHFFLGAITEYVAKRVGDKIGYNFLEEGLIKQIIFSGLPAAILYGSMNEEKIGEFCKENPTLSKILFGGVGVGLYALGNWGMELFGEENLNNEITMFLGGLEGFLLAGISPKVLESKEKKTKK